MPMRKLILLSGAPGSGKSYFSSSLRKAKNNSHVYIVSSDSIRNLVCGNQSDLTKDKVVWEIFYELPKAYSKDPDAIVILDCTNTRSKYRLDTLERMKPYFDDFSLVLFNLPKEIILKQNTDREYPVPIEAVEHFIKVFELPSEEEKQAFNHIFIIENHDFKQIIDKI